MKKTVFNTITIRIPSEQVYKNPKSGKLTLIPSLTKTGQISKRLGIPCIELKKDDHLMHPVIEKNGNETLFQKKESKPIKKESKPIKKESKPIKKESKPIKKEITKHKVEIKQEIINEPINKELFLEEYLGIRDSGINDKNSTILQSKIYDRIFETIDKLYSSSEFKEFINSINESDLQKCLDYILNWFNKKNNKGNVEYSNFVSKVIYPSLLKNIKGNPNKIKLMILANEIGTDSYFYNYFKNNDQLNKLRVAKSFTDNKQVVNELKKNHIFDKLYKDLLATASGNRDLLYQNKNYKPNFIY